MKKLLSYATTTITLFAISASNAYAQIKNPAVKGDLGGHGGDVVVEAAESGKIFTNYFVQLWQAIIALGGLAVLLYFVWGAIQWITAGGDSSKIEKARNMIMQAVIGMIILVASFTIIGVISSVFFGDSFNLLAPQFNPAN